MSSRTKYIPFAGALVFSILGLFLLSQFVIADIFSTKTLSLLFFGVLSSITLSIIAYPKFKNWFVNKMRFKNSVYWAINLTLLMLALISFGLGISNGGPEYTAYMAST